MRFCCCLRLGLRNIWMISVCVLFMCVCWWSRIVWMMLRLSLLDWFSNFLMMMICVFFWCWFVWKFRFGMKLGFIWKNWLSVIVMLMLFILILVVLLRNRRILCVFLMSMFRLVWVMIFFWCNCVRLMFCLRLVVLMKLFSVWIRCVVSNLIMLFSCI